jgi:REP element-mobilizing transposase RayT
MATPRHQLIDPDYPMHYHIVSRCVRRSWLCGVDRLARKDYEHRKDWLEQRMWHLAQYFAVAIDAFAIMSNHFHLVVFFDPQESYRWNDEEVAERWLRVFPPGKSDMSESDQVALFGLHRELLLLSPERLLHARETLGSLSMFMKHLKQPIAYQANREDRCSGHFFEGRFYSGALLDENAVIAAMAYVDLNPIRARITQHIEQYKAASGYTRARIATNTPTRLKEAVQPLVSGLNQDRPALSMRLEGFLDILKQCEVEYNAPASKTKTSRWYNRIASLRKRQRAFGTASELSSWRTDRGWSTTGMPLPVG